METAATEKKLIFPNGGCLLENWVNKTSRQDAKYAKIAKKEKEEELNHGGHRVVVRKLLFFLSDTQAKMMIVTYECPLFTTFTDTIFTVAVTFSFGLIPGLVTAFLTWVLGFIGTYDPSPFLVCSVAEHVYKAGIQQNLFPVPIMNILSRLPVNIVDRFIVIFGGYFISLFISQNIIRRFCLVT
jgi:hypothetical protein